jgi:hypothetical protein
MPTALASHRAVLASFVAMFTMTTGTAVKAFGNATAFVKAD